MIYKRSSTDTLALVCNENMPEINSQFTTQIKIFSFSAMQELLLNSSSFKNTTHSIHSGMNNKILYTENRVN